MIERKLDDLISDIKQRRTAGDRPPVLLLGAGASVESGIGAMKDLFSFAKCDDFAHFVTYIAPMTTAERFRLLSQFLQTQKPAQVTKGYQALATLCAEAYFDLVLTLNLDPLLDDALANARLWRKDYLVIVNGVHRPDRLAPLLSAQSPRVKIVKMHGDLFHRYMAWTPDEMDTYVMEISDRLKGALYGRDLLVVGTSLRDERIRELTLSVAENGGAVWYTTIGDDAPDFLKAQPTVRAVLGEECGFEHLFQRLAVDLGVMQPEVIEAAPAFSAPEVAPSPTMDDFMSAVVSVLDKNGTPASTGFLVAKPRIIVTDAYPTRQCIVDGRVKISAGGRKFEAEVLNEDVAYDFGPLFLKAPSDLNIPALHVDANPLLDEDVIWVGVAAGEKTGIATGKVVSAAESKVNINPIGPVPYLVELEVAVAQGASGAPVVDRAFVVRGFIVAGSTDPNNPVSYMFPASRWAKSLKAALKK
ncbi:MAG TPA: SIR2 family protein [Bryobacteraceae bacterium]|nr:SIR2 family protein [Bryobacteraceae bacterium]